MWNQCLPNFFKLVMVLDIGLFLSMVTGEKSLDVLSKESRSLSSLSLVSTIWVWDALSKNLRRNLGGVLI